MQRHKNKRQHTQTHQQHSNDHHPPASTTTTTTTTNTHRCTANSTANTLDPFRLDSDAPTAPAARGHRHFAHPEFAAMYEIARTIEEIVHGGYKRIVL